MHVYSNGPSENGIIGLEKGISLGVKLQTIESGVKRTADPDSVYKRLLL